MSDNVEYLPVWKNGATAEERFLELAMIARKRPERFEHVIIIWNYTNQKDGDRMRTEYVTSGCDTMDALGLVELAKEELHRYTRG